MVSYQARPAVRAVETEKGSISAENMATAYYMGQITTKQTNVRRSEPNMSARNKIKLPEAKLSISRINAPSLGTHTPRTSTTTVGRRQK